VMLSLRNLETGWLLRRSYTTLVHITRHYNPSRYTVNTARHPGCVAGTGGPAVRCISCGVGLPLLGAGGLPKHACLHNGASLGSQGSRVARRGNDGVGLPGCLPLCHHLRLRFAGPGPLLHHHARASRDAAHLAPVVSIISV
jgi:hypothetical protein